MQKPVVWIGGRIRSPFMVEEPAPFRPDLVLWLNVLHDQVLAADVIEPGAPLAVLADRLETALADPQHPRPTIVRVPDEASAKVVRGVVPAGVKVEVGPVPELEAIAELMGEKVSGKGSAHSYLEGGSISPEAIGCLFREAAALYRLAPWRKFADTDVLELEVPALGITGACLSVIGAMKENFGVLIFDSFDDFDEFLNRGSAGAAAGAKEMDFGASLLSLNFELGADIPDRMRSEIHAHRWPVAGARAYPLVLPVERNGDACAPTTRDIQIATAVAAGVAALFARNRHRMGGREIGPMTEAVTVEVPEPLEVTVRYPHPAMAAEAPSEEAFSEEQYARTIERGAAQIRTFLDSPAFAAMPEDWPEDAGFVCESLHRSKVDYVDGRWDGLTARHVSWFLLEHFPCKVSADAGTMERTPEILDRYFQWLGEEGLEPEASVARLRARVEQAREEFLSEASNPANFGPAKSIVMAMKSEGVDFGDAAAVTKFMEKHNRKLGGGGRAGKGRKK